MSDEDSPKPGPSGMTNPLKRKNTDTESAASSLAAAMAAQLNAATLAALSNQLPVITAKKSNGQSSSSVACSTAAAAAPMFPFLAQDGASGAIVSRANLPLQVVNSMAVAMAAQQVKQQIQGAIVSANAAAVVNAAAAAKKQGARLHAADESNGNVSAPFSSVWANDKFLTN